MYDIVGFFLYIVTKTYDIVTVVLTLDIEEWQEGCFKSVLISRNDIEDFPTISKKKLTISHPISLPDIIKLQEDTFSIPVMSIDPECTAPFAAFCWNLFFIYSEEKSDVSQYFDIIDCIQVTCTLEQTFVCGRCRFPSSRNKVSRHFLIVGRGFLRRLDSDCTNPLLLGHVTDYNHQIVKTDSDAVNRCNLVTFHFFMEVLSEWLKLDPEAVQLSFPNDSDPGLLCPTGSDEEA